MSDISEKVVIILRAEIIKCVKELLETKHLYQTVRIDTTDIRRLSDEAKDSPEGKQAMERHRMLSRMQTKGPRISDEVALSQFLRPYRKKIIDATDLVLNNPWSFSTDVVENHLIANGGKPSEAITHFNLPTISVNCEQCDATLPPHNSGYRGQIYDIQEVSWRVSKGGSQTHLQTFVFLYQCQSCKNEPLIFLVHRKGDKLTLTGRNHFETVRIPKTIPEQEADYFSDAITAYNTGNILAGLFLLRTTIEQYMRRILNVTVKKTGDELGVEYARLLDDEFPQKFTSLKSIYNELSGCIHAAEKNSSQFEKSKKDIEQHFELLKMLPLKTTDDPSQNEK